MNSSTRNTSAAYAQFSKSIGYFIFYRLLGIMSLLLVMAASLFLIIWYSFITGSQFIDGYMEDIYENINLPYFQEITYNGMSSVCERVNSIFGRDIMYPPGVNIKEEHVEVIYESNSQDTESDSEVEDVTEQFKAEQEANKEVIDLTGEADDKIEEHEEEEEVLKTDSSDSDSTAPMGSTDSEEKRPKKKHHGGVKHGKGKHARMNQLKHQHDGDKELVEVEEEMLNENDKEEDYTVIPDATEEE